MDLIIKGMRASSPHISVASAPLTGEQKGYLLKVEIGPAMPEGRFNELVTILTNYGDYSEKTPTTEQEK